MKKVLIVLVIILVGLNVYLLTKDLKQSSKPLGLFQRENDEWVFYSMEDSEKQATGLKVAVINNSNVPEWPEEMYAALSPDGKRVAYMQKPAWPHQIFTANINGTEKKEFVGPILPSPTHAVIENQFRWSEDNKLTYAVTIQDCGPAGSGGTFETVLYEKNFLSQEEEVVSKFEHSCNDTNTGGKVIPVD